MEHGKFPSDEGPKVARKGMSHKPRSALGLVYFGVLSVGGVQQDRDFREEVKLVWSLPSP